MGNFEYNEILLTSNNEAETQRYGEILGSLLKKGSIVALDGQLGAGKTYFTKGIAKGAGVNDSKVVTSPTFTLVNEYSGNVSVFHMDAYRISSIDEMYDLGCDEILRGDGIAIIEWAERVKECLPTNILNVYISYKTMSERLIRIFDSANLYSKVLQGIRDKLGKIEF